MKRGVSTPIQQVISSCDSTDKGSHSSSGTISRSWHQRPSRPNFPRRCSGSTIDSSLWRWGWHLKKRYCRELISDSTSCFVTKRNLPYYTNPLQDLYRLRLELGRKEHMLYGRLCLGRIHRL